MKILKWVAIVLAVLLVLALSGYGIACHQTNQRFSVAYEAHEVDIEHPWPLSEEELEELRQARLETLSEDEVDDADLLADVDLEEIARQRAEERGKHLVTARFVCGDCHGDDFSGGIMADDPALGKLYGPNLTGGKGSPVAEYTMADWDLVVRHGILPDGTAAAMPSVDFINMSDQELSDIIAYIESFPAVDNEVPPVSFGPMGTILVGTGQFEITAENIEHHTEHAALPPEPADTPEFGAHLAQVCTGCHGQKLTGGPIAGGPPGWPPASNLTPHESGLGGWTFEQFDTLMRKGKRPDGADAQEPMLGIISYGANMEDIEMRALFTYLSSLEPQPADGE